MIVSEKRISANRRNSQLSTGPKTDEGKGRSRSNSLKHGLCSSVIQAEDIALVSERTTEWFYALNPQNEFQNWMVDRVAIASIRIERAERIERRVRDKICLRAELTWDDDRRLETEILGAMMPKRPLETVAALRRSPQGCEWLMSRWAMLARVADDKEVWTEEQIDLAFDMLGTPVAFRANRRPGESLDFEGKVLQTDGDLAVIARREIASLKESREITADLDEVERTLTESDLTNHSDPELRLLRRYETTLHTRLRWCIAQINNDSPHHAPYPGLTPNWTTKPEEPPKEEGPTEDEMLAEAHPVNSIHPPFCLEPDEYPVLGQKADIPMILKSRKEKRIKKADARRDAKRRKLDQIRA